MMAQSAGPLHVLVVDDEPAIVRFVRTGLTGQGYVVATVETGRAALEELRKGTTDLIVLDLGLPDIDGLDVIAHVRGEGSTIPIIVLSSRLEERSKVMALDIGADDYLVKPFGIEELLARVRVAQRHLLARDGDPPLFRVGDLTVDLIRRIVTVRGAEVRFSRREYDLLRLLVSHAGKVLTRDFILRQVWGPGTNVQYLRIYIRALRQKIEMMPERPYHILTETGVGYRLRAPD
jgi:two-component system KDP operon response regulator KdpE